MQGLRDKGTQWVEETASGLAGLRQKQRMKNSKKEHCPGRTEFQCHNNIKTQLSYLKYTVNFRKLLYFT